MKKILTLSLFIIMLSTSMAMAKSVFTRINKIDGKDAIEIYCSFTNIPTYRHNIREKRVDFILEDTTLKPDFTFFKEDDKIVKILSRIKNNKAIISFFFRFPPQKFEVTPNIDENKLTINILLGNPYSTALPNFSSKLAGLTVLERTTKDFSNPLVASPYAADWKSFFKLYESEIHLSMPVQFTILPFPAMAYLLPDKTENNALLSDEIKELAKEGLWHAILPLILEQINTEKDPEIKKKLAFTYGDVLSRDNNFIDAYKQFYLLGDEYPEEEIGIFAKYLLNLLRARFEDPFIADFELRNIEHFLPTGNPLLPYFRITQIETALATEQYKRMGELLALDDIAYPEDTAIIKELRQADFWYGTGESIKAYIGYQLLDKYELLLEKVYSLNGYCDTQYQQKQFPEASKCYATLNNHLKDKEKLGISTFRQYLADLHYKTDSQMVDYFARVENTYHGTDAGFRGALKKTDLQYLILKDWSENAILYYKHYGANAPTREGREEATFKEALVNRLSGNNIESINIIMTFLRDFRKGTLQGEGQALLIELLPIVIKEYEEKQMYMEALILAKQNRTLFLKNWVDIDLLAKLAVAYHAVGIFNEASKLYLYLITLSSEDQKEQYYTPMIAAAYAHGTYNIVEDFSDQYSYRYPEGKFKKEILLFRIKSMLAEGRFDEAIALLPETIPVNEEFSLLAANLYFHENNYQQVVSILDRDLTISEKKLPRSSFLLAESMYQLGDLENAMSIFTTIPKTSIHYNQALYRVAELFNNEGKKDSALKFYKKLVETGTNELWIKLAQQELEINQIF